MTGSVDWLKPVVRALDRRRHPSPIFFRDDDVGWEDEALFELCDLFQARSVPFDLAVIPAALSDERARDLRRRLEASRPCVRVHQHGYTHRNHEVRGRRCEFGVARSISLQREDILRGAEFLREALEPFVDPIFTPPWNRCVRALGPVLVDEGFRVLSRDLSAGSIDLPGLCELPITVDWVKRPPGGPFSVRALAARLSRSIADDAVVGIMLHHGAMGDTEMAALDDLLRVVADHTKALTLPMRDAALLEELH